MYNNKLIYYYLKAMLKFVEHQIKQELYNMLIFQKNS